MRNRHSRDSRLGSVYLSLAVILLIASAGLLGAHYKMASDDAVPTVEAAKAPGVDAEAVKQATEQFLATELTMRIGDQSESMTWSDLGAVVDEAGLARAASRAEPSELLDSLQKRGLLPIELDEQRAREQLDQLAAQYSRPPQSAWLDVEARTIHESQDGVSLDVFAAISALTQAAHSGANGVSLPVVALPAQTTTEDLGIDDISHVLARFETPFSTSDFSRNFNLQLAASKLNGYVLKPGVQFSFNDVVGARTENEGYKIAGVITAGQMVDGLAGGTCQISTTLHGAAFFAGLDIERATPHSRPSTYVTMGLDATVVYPHVDLKLTNNYEFPVAIHYKVTRGKSYVEILGKQRPYDKVVFERKISERIEFDMVTREDDAMPVGSMSVDQYGFYGYRLDRIRKMFKDGKVVKKDKWAIRYAPVTEYVRTGSNPDPNLVPPKPKKKKKKKRLKEPKEGVYRMSQ